MVSRGSGLVVVLLLLLLLLLLLTQTFVAVMRPDALSSSPLARDARLCRWTQLPQPSACASLRCKLIIKPSRGGGVRHVVCGTTATSVGKAPQVAAAVDECLAACS